MALGVYVMGSVNPLLGRSVLIVEDEPLIALDLHDTLHKAGASILAAITIKEALELIARAQICAAIVDVSLGGHDCSSLCAALAKRQFHSCSTRDTRTRPRSHSGQPHQLSTNQRLERRWSTQLSSYFHLER